MTVSTAMMASAAAAVVLIGALDPAWAQSPPPPGAPPPPSGPQYALDEIHVRDVPPSVARGAEYPPIPDTMVGAEPKGLEGGIGAPILDGRAIVAAEDGAVPAGITPLERDVFSSDDFYIDKELWSDPRYWRCNSPAAVSASQGSNEAPIVGDDFPRTVSWGYCDRDYDVENIVSPYPYATAQEQYAALLAEAESRGGPTEYTHDNPPPDYSGSYSAGVTGIGGFGQNQKTRSWIAAAINQVPTYLSLLTPEYQQRMVQQLYHDAHNETVWTAPYCWPDSYMYQWFGSGGGNMIVTPDLIQINGGLNERIVNEVYMNREFMTEDSEVPYLTGTNRQYWGDSVGFWDGDVLITWTSNLKHWISHGWFESSDQMQVIQIFTPIDDNKDGKFVGLMQETVFYDPEALVKPVRVVYRWQRSDTFATAGARNWQQCPPTYFPIDGQQTPVSPGTTIEYDVPDFNGRPWADIWVKHFEQHMQRPEEADVLADFQ